MDEERIAEIKKINENKQKFIEKEKKKALLISKELKNKKFCVAEKIKFWHFIIQETKKYLDDQFTENQKNRNKKYYGLEEYEYSTGFNKYLYEFESITIQKSNSQIYFCYGSLYFNDKNEFIEFIDKIEKIAQEKIKYYKLEDELDYKKID